jgi:glucokinase
MGPPPEHGNDAMATSPDGYPRLVADVGGTRARFGWVAAPGARVDRVRVMPVAAFDSLEAAARDYLGVLRAALGPSYRAPRRAAFAVATAVDDDVVDFTNSGWRFSRADLARALDLEQLVVLNDFAALALALPGLDASRYRCHAGCGQPSPAGPLAVLGPGTGLGVAAVIPGSAGWIAVPGEGGHATLAPGDDFESALLARVRSRFGHVSAERLLSGIGLPVLHDAVAGELGLPAEALPAEAITARALQGGDPACERTLAVFCALLGSFAGNVALTFGALGGMFVGGGIVPQLGERFFASAFRERFEAKGRFRPYLARIPTAVITDPLAALDGAAAAIR